MTNVSKEYAEALFLLSEENGECEAIATALETVSDVLKENPAYVEFLSSPAIPKNERVQAIGTAFASLPETAVSFLQLLCERGHIRTYDTVAEHFAALCREAQNRTTATVISAVELTDEEKARLNEKLNAAGNKTVTIEWTVDESLLGGVIVEMDGKVLDGSLRHRLQEVKEVISSERET